MLLHPNKKNTKRLRDVLNQLYGHLDSSAVQGSASHDVSIASNRIQRFNTVETKAKNVIHYLLNYTSN